MAEIRIIPKLKIISNHHKREILYWNELLDKEKLEFDWIIDNNDDPFDFSFFRYKDNVYCLSDFMRIDKYAPFPNYWNGYSSDSFFSGILIKYPYTDDNEFDDTDFIIVGWYYS